jgi:hypothetical protein
MITANTRFLGVDSTKVDLTEKKDALNNAITEYYTAEEIVAPKYKVYTALLTQRGENAPTAIVLENTLGDISFVRNDIGYFEATSNDLFTINKTFILFGVETNNDNYDGIAIVVRYKNIGVIDFFTTGTTAMGEQLDDVLTNTSFEIRVYE